MTEGNEKKTFKDTLAEARTWIVLVASTIASVAATQGGAAVFIPDVARDAAKEQVETEAGAAFEALAKRVNDLAAGQQVLQSRLHTCNAGMDKADERIRALRIEVEVIKALSTNRGSTPRVERIEKRVKEEVRLEEPALVIEDFADEELPEIEPLPESYGDFQQQQIKR
jgi:hypothetical protein